MGISSKVGALLGGLMLAIGTVCAQEVIVYPAKGQSAEQTEKDKFDCYQWAKGQTGFDPMAPPTASTPPPPSEAPTASTGKGAVGGAAAARLAQQGVDRLHVFGLREEIDGLARAQTIAVPA